jgi:signal transduction histidine kinase
LYNLGLGIGLAVARTVVEDHGGAIEAQSEGLSKGSTFLAMLPVSRSAADRPRE